MGEVTFWIEVGGMARETFDAMLAMFRHNERAAYVAWESERLAWEPSASEPER